MDSYISLPKNLLIKECDLADLLAASPAKKRVGGFGSRGNNTHAANNADWRIALLY
jgi:hypothetical protein